MKKVFFLVAIVTLLLYPTKSYAFNLFDWIYQLFRFERVFVYQSNDIVSTAYAYNGFHAQTHRKQLTEMMNIDPVNIPWCAGFMNYVLDKAGYKHTNSLLASSYHYYGTRTKTPERGDIVIIRREGGSGRHVGFFYGFSYIDGVRHVQLLGGNQDRSVKVSEYPVSIVIEYRRPVLKS